MSERKGLPWFAWVGIGCGVLIILGVVAIAGLGLFVGSKVKDLAEDFEDRPVYTTAAAIARFNPEIELVEADEEKQIVTMRSVKTGEVMTFHLDDIKSGNFSFEKDGERVDVSTGGNGVTVTSDEGTTRFGAGTGTDLPDWLPVPRGASTKVGYTANNDTESSGLAQLQDFGSSEDVLDFYRRELKGQGYELAEQNMSSGTTAISSVTASKKSPKRTITVTSNRNGDEAEEITITYSGQNG